jgi:hypothetical protein
MPGLHAKLSPSAAHRWMNCPGSVRLIGDESSTSSNAAMKGTAAHKLLETMIIADHHDVREYHGATILVPGDDVEQKPDGGYWDAELYLPGVAALDPDKPRPGWFMFMVDEEMVAGVQVTIDEVDRLHSEMWNVKVYPERYIDMTWLDPRFGGTADVTLVEGEGDDDFLGVQADVMVEYEGWVHLVDHKNGWILVDHKDNEQLLNYAVGLLHEHPKAKGVRVTISQPNAAHIEGPTRTAEYTRKEIEAFAKKMKKAALETDKPNAPLRAGDWCTFCPAKTRCKEFDESVLNEAKGEFADADELPETLPVPDDISELVRKARWVGLINGWAREIMAAIQSELEAGKEVPGWKLVQGRANRIWPDGYTEESIAEEFIALGVPEKELWTKPELRSPAQIEKLGPKGRTKAIRAVRNAIKAKVAELAFKPDGKITVAEDTDPREAIGAFHNAAEEFSDDEDFGA